MHAAATAAAILVRLLICSPLPKVFNGHSVIQNLLSLKTITLPYHNSDTICKQFYVIIARHEQLLFKNNRLGVELLRVQRFQCGLRRTFTRELADTSAVQNEIAQASSPGGRGVDSTVDRARIDAIKKLEEHHCSGSRRGRVE